MCGGRKQENPPAVVGESRVPGGFSGTDHCGKNPELVFQLEKLHFTTMCVNCMWANLPSNSVCVATCVDLNFNRVCFNGQESCKTDKIYELCKVQEVGCDDI